LASCLSLNLAFFNSSARILLSTSFIGHRFWFRA
jgi:hypothetical protein